MILLKYISDKTSPSVKAVFLIQSENNYTAISRRKSYGVSITKTVFVIHMFVIVIASSRVSNLCAEYVMLFFILATTTSMYVDYS